MNQYQQEFDKIDNLIDSIEIKIQKVTENIEILTNKIHIIENIETNLNFSIEELALNDMIYVNAYRLYQGNDSTYLNEEQAQLRREKNLLREEEILLLKEKNLLLREKIQLRTTQNQPMNRIGNRFLTNRSKSHYEFCS